MIPAACVDLEVLDARPHKSALHRIAIALGLSGFGSTGGAPTTPVGALYIPQLPHSSSPSNRRMITPANITPNNAGI